MTKSELIEIFRRQYGYEPDGDELEILLNEYQVEDEEKYEPPRQQSRVFQFDRNRCNTVNDPVNDLLKEVKNIFGGIAGSSQRSVNKDSNDNLTEFSLMLMVFLLKAGLYFSLKSAYSRGFDFANL